MPILHHQSYSEQIQPRSKMRMKQVARIELIDQPTNGYTSGDVVKGVVHLRLRHSTAVQCVKLHLLGTSQNRAQAVEW
jgi:hypothetical protein